LTVALIGVSLIGVGEVFGQIAVFHFIKSVNPLLIASFTIGIAFSGFFVSLIFNLVRRFEIIPEESLLIIFSSFYLLYLVLIKIISILTVEIRDWNF
jgi:hypothetical protein